MPSQLILAVVSAVQEWTALVRGCCPPRPDPFESGQVNLEAPGRVNTTPFRCALDKVHAAIKAARDAGERHPALDTIAAFVHYRSPPPLLTGERLPVHLPEHWISAAEKAAELLQKSDARTAAQGGGGAHPPKRRGPKRDELQGKTNKVIFDAWKSGQHPTYEALARELHKTTREVQLAIDSERKRLKRMPVN